MGAILLALALLSCASPYGYGLGDYYGATGFPRVFMYSLLGSNGSPYRSGTTLIMPTIENQARWDAVILDVVGNRAATAATDNRPVVQNIRRLNPAIKLFAYSGGAYQFKCATGWYWDSGHPGGGGFDWNNSGGLDAADSVFSIGCDTSGTDLGWSRVRAIRQNNALLYSRTRDRNNDQRKDAFCNGSDAFGHCTANPEVDFAMPGVAQALADTIVAWATEIPGAFNGIFVDELCTSVAFQSDGGGEDSVDYARSGNANLSQWDTAYRAGVLAFVNRIRSTIPPDWILTGNCGAIGASRTALNGWMRENFPTLNGGTWNSNMLGPAPGVPTDVGYLGDDALYTAPINTLLTKQRRDPTESVFQVNLQQSDPDGQRQHRWILGSATLAGGMGTMVGTSQDQLRGYLPWWADEFSVTPAGLSTIDPHYKHWLGDPLGPYYTVGAGYRRDFKRGTVLVNPSGGDVTFPLAAGVFFRIRGIQAPDVNDGAPTSSQVVHTKDAVFLQRRPALP